MLLSFDIHYNTLLFVHIVCVSQPVNLYVHAHGLVMCQFLSNTTCSLPKSYLLIFLLCNASHTVSIKNKYFCYHVTAILFKYNKCSNKQVKQWFPTREEYLLYS